MTTLAVVGGWLGIGAGLGWLAVALAALRGLRDLPDLEPLDRPPAGRVRVVLPTRDDDPAVVADTVARLAAQRDVSLEIVVVDDRSGPGARDGLRALAELHRDAQVVRVDALPPGWMGKCHACHTGAGLPPGPHGMAEWLLFVDADSRLGPDAVARAVRVAERTGAAHVCLVPELRGQTLAGRAVALAMSLGLGQQARGIEHDRGLGYVGVGAFTLVRRDAYARVDGHRGVRLEVVEDLRLGGALRRAGYRARVRFAVDVFDVTWITSARSAFSVMEKNFFALFGFRTASFAAGFAGLLAAWLGALLGPALALALDGGSLARAAALVGGIGVAAVVAASARFAHRYRWPGWLALLAPPAFGLVLAVMLNSAVRTLRRGGVRWRDSFYPLADLRDAARAAKT
ncbi:MAG: glycosyltransferase [Planctomycetes bacterium]|nr:glycosyltransferase [Planctomycetota bacterium]